MIMEELVFMEGAVLCEGGLKLHITHMHGSARIKGPKRPGYPRITTERETADAVP